jgi:hypothetical protein
MQTHRMNHMKMGAFVLRRNEPEAHFETDDDNYYINKYHNFNVYTLVICDLCI